MNTHASFFSGAGGMDIGLERAGWRTVSFSEIEPYACAILETRWPGVPNLGDITRLSGQPRRGDNAIQSDIERDGAHQPYGGADLWTAGFPCQDLSVAGKRAGFAGERSVLAFAFLALVERYRPPAVLLENVPGLLSSHRGRDMAALVGRLGDLGYGWAFRVLDAQFFGVPQRRRRVFILGLRSDPDDADGHLASERAAAVLSVGSRCRRHPAAGIEAGPEPAERAARSVTGSSGKRHDPDTDTYINALDQRRGGADDNEAQVGHLVAATLTAPDTRRRIENGRRQDGSRTDRIPIVAHSVRPRSGMPQGWNANLVSTSADSDGGRATPGMAGRVDLDPEGIDSARYRVIGNGVAAPVAEWIGRRLLDMDVAAPDGSLWDEVAP